MFFARSLIRMASPISSRKISPPSESAPACTISSAASWMDMKNRVMRSSVMVTRSAGGNLFLEQRDHGTIGSENISEAHRTELLTAACRQRPQRIIMHDELRPSLCRAHDIGGSYRFVGRDEHEVLDPALIGDPCRGQAAEHVVADAFEHVGFHQRDMLVRCSMKDHVDLVLDYGLSQSCFVGDGGKYRLHIGDVEGLQCPVDIVECELILFIEDEKLRLPFQDEPAKLRADGPASARHQDRAPPRSSSKARPCPQEPTSGPVIRQCRFRGSG